MSDEPEGAYKGTSDEIDGQSTGDPGLLDDPDSPEHDERPRGQPTYLAPKYPRVQAVGTRMLRRALAQSEDQGGQVDDLWQTFRSMVWRHEYALFVDSIADGIRDEFRAAILAEQRETITKQAVDEIRDKIAEDVRKQLTEELRVSLRPQVEAEIKKRLTDEMTPDLRQYHYSKIRRELEAEARQNLRAELAQDPAFVESIKQDLKRSILGL